MKEKRQKYSEELEVWTEKFEKENGKKAAQNDLPKDLLAKVTKVSWVTMLRECWSVLVCVDHVFWDVAVT